MPTFCSNLLNISSKMLKSTLILIICLTHGVLPGPSISTISTGIRMKALTPLESMTSDIVLVKCGVPQNVEEFIAKLDPMAFCNVQPKNDANLDKIYGIPFVCFAIQSLLHQWCDKDGRFDDLLSAIRGSKSSYTVDACAINGSLYNALKPTDYTHIKSYVERLRHEFSVPGHCQKICVDDGSITVFCKYLLIINEQLELLRVNVDPNQTGQSIQMQKVNNSGSSETVKPKEEYVVPSLVEKAQGHSYLKVESQPTKNSEPTYDTQSKELQSPKIQPNPTVTTNKIQTLNPVSSVHNSPVVEKVQEDLSHENQLKSAHQQFNNKNIETSLESNKPETQQYDIDQNKPSLSNDRQKTTLTDKNEQSLKSDFEDEEYPLENNEGLPPNVASNKDVIQSNIIDTLQQDNSKDKIDTITQNRANDIYHSGIHFEAEDSNFFTYFLFAIGVFILGYVIFHNKNKVLGLLVEGRRSNSTNRRRGVGSSASYRKLDCTLEEAVSSAPPSHGPNIVY